MITNTAANSLRIGIVGPTRIGKTTIINSLLRSGEQLLAQTSVRMRWADTATEKKIQLQRKELEGWRVSRQFNPGALAGTDKLSYFRLQLDVGIPDAEIHIDLLDYPGSWLDPAARSGNEAAWEDCRTFIADSNVLLIPVDAVVLMESVGDANRHLIPGLLTTPEIQDVARDWARKRHQHAGEPALVILCPVRTESYFSDNGGRRNRDDELFDQVREVYTEVLETIRAEAPATQIRYCPVDTVGCVEVLSTAWKSNETTGQLSFSTEYRVRRRADGGPPAIRMAGVDDMLALITQCLFARVTGDLETLARQRHVDAAELSEAAHQDYGTWLNLWHRLSGKRAAWLQHERIGRLGAIEADALVADLGRQLKRLAELPMSNRTRNL